MDFFKLEIGRAVLLRQGCQADPEARRLQSEGWGRRLADQTFIAALHFDAARQAVSEQTLRATAHALMLPPEDIVREVRDTGGTYLGPL